MKKKDNQPSRTHDLMAALLGAFAAVALITSRYNVDTEGPDPFYKGPLIFPVMVLSMMIIAALPAAKRLLWPAQNSSWTLDGEGWPQKTMVVLGLLITMLAGLPLVGLEICAWLFLTASLYYLGHRSFFCLIVLPVVMSGLIVLIFKHFLGVFFPTPLLVQWLWG